MASLDDMYEEVRLLAMLAVQKPETTYFIRRLCRWYSHHFHTPLHVVESEIPIEDVFLHFYEHRYEEMEDAELDAELHELLLTPEERRARDKALKLQREKEKADDDAFLEMIKQRAEEAKAKDPELAKPFIPGQNPAPALTPVIGNPALTPITPQAPLKEIPPDIRMEFVSDIDDEADPLGRGANDPD